MKQEHQRIPQHGRGRGGFTLIELLMVIVIIGILAALLLPVIGGAMRRAHRTRIGAEITSLETSLTQFKSKYGVFPPSRIHLHEDPTTYDLQSPTGTIPNTPQDIHRALDIRTVKFLKRLWPNFNVNQNWDWNGTGTASTSEPGMDSFGGIDLNGSECLVFFLGGMPQLSPGNVRSVEGFSRNPQFPFSRPTNDGTIQFLIAGHDQRSQPLFEFDSGRLTDLDGDGFWEYYDNYQEPPQVSGPGQFDPDTMIHPYAYFTSYEGQGYNWLPLSNAALPVVTYDNAWDASGNLSNPRGMLWPFSLNSGNPSQVKWWNEDSYQLISPGINDGLIGHGLLPDPNNVANALVIFNPDNAAYNIDQALSPEVHDDITNFSGGQVQDMK